ncbi:hypothetical protein PAPYR_3455 [Paratrimastix pyriformis]|uniref:Uncharacterized protein n=1 Tax=Paratrimastix pyriformis TaxID=342808 RepID=A0ABQ8UMM1_9EUKA|nr:hypothetical protein PAPYR_3455 [Paratrimastix pyriformis]
MPTPPPCVHTDGTSLLVAPDLPWPRLAGWPPQEKSMKSLSEAVHMIFLHLLDSYAPTPRLMAALQPMPPAMHCPVPHTHAMPILCPYPYARARQLFQHVGVKPYPYFGVAELAERVVTSCGRKLVMGLKKSLACEGQPDGEALDLELILGYFHLWMAVTYKQPEMNFAARFLKSVINQLCRGARSVAPHPSEELRHYFRYVPEEAASPDPAAAPPRPVGSPQADQPPQPQAPATPTAPPATPSRTPAAASRPGPRRPGQAPRKRADTQEQDGRLCPLRELARLYWLHPEVDRAVGVDALSEGAFRAIRRALKPEIARLEASEGTAAPGLDHLASKAKALQATWAAQRETPQARRPTTAPAAAAALAGLEDAEAATQPAALPSPAALTNRLAGAAPPTRPPRRIPRFSIRPAAAAPRQGHETLHQTAQPQHAPALPPREPAHSMAILPPAGAAPLPEVPPKLPTPP